MYTLMNKEYTVSAGKPIVYIFTRDEHRRRVLFTDSALMPEFYIPDKTSNVRDIYNRPVRLVNTRLPRHVGEQRKNYPWSANADILFEDLWAIKHGILSTFNEGFIPCEDPGTVKPLKFFFDIEVKSPSEILPLPDDPKWPIVLISVITSESYDIYLYVFNSPNFGDTFTHVETVNGVEYPLNVHCKYFDDEVTMLETFAVDFSNLNPDTAGGYNSNLYDWPYIMNRAVKIGARISRLSPFNLVDCRSHPKYGWTSRIKGVALLDYCQIYKTHVKPTGERDTYDFKVVVKDETGYEYEDYGDRIEKIHGTRTLIEYGIRDVFALRLFDDTIELTDFVDRIRRVVGCSFREAQHNSQVITTWLRRITDSPLPTVAWSSQDKPSKKVTGAMVLSPPKGIHYNVACLDLKSLYPTLIMAFNLSPEMKNANGDITVPIVDKNGMPTGAIRFKSHPEGIMSKAVRRISDEREKVRALRGNLDVDDPRQDLLEKQETTLKFIACSFYGVMGFQGFCLYDPDVANAITSLGRTTVKLIIDTLASHGYKTVYGDTDSVFVKLHSNDWKEGLALEKIINDKLIEFAREHGAIASPVTKYEKFFASILFKQKIGSDTDTAKKRYAGFQLYDNGKYSPKLKMVGLEPRRSDASILTRELMKDFLRLVLQENNVSGALNVLRDVWQNMPDMPAYKIAIPKGLRRKEYKHTSPWLRGRAWMQTHVGKIFREDIKPRLIYVDHVIGENVAFQTDAICITDETDVPSGIVVDWKTMRNKTIRRKMESILDAIGLDWIEAMRGLRQTKWEEFM